MPMDRFLIADFNSGLQTDLKPWRIPAEAFARLNNAYVFRGRVRKRFGSSYMGLGNLTNQALGSRLSYLVGITNGTTGNLSGTAPGTAFDIGQGFSVGDDFFTVNALGTPGTMLRNDGNVGVSTFNTTTGAFAIVNAAKGINVYFYPAQPVMGLCLYEEGPVNDQPAWAFDTEFAYTFVGGYWQQSGAAVWHGNDLNFFWTCNWDGITADQVTLFVSNFQVTNTSGAGAATDDPIWYYNGTTWAPFSAPRSLPTYPYTVFKGDGSFVLTARIIVAFKNRLLLLNTIEQTPGSPGTNRSFVNRCRFSHNGSPFSQVVSGGNTAPYAWLEPNQVYTVGGAKGIGDGGGFIDATTEEAITSAEFIKDRLIVYFERSTWELAYTGNQILPFVWQKINTELGCEAPQSTVAFDTAVLTIGNTGVHACSGANVTRIDNKIPDQIFQINTQNQGTTRVCGIRDYFVEMVYWAFPSVDENVDDIFPNRVLVYNYRDNTWAFNDDCITCFGYFEQLQGLTWENTSTTWEQSNFSWNSGTLQPESRQVIAGNQEGFVFLIEPDLSSNAPVMQLTDIVVNGTGLNLVIVNHTLQEGDYIYLQGLEPALQNTTGTNQFIFQIYQVLDDNTIFINPAVLPSTYAGGGFVARVSQIDILSKQWNPYVDKGKDIHLAKIDFGVEKTTSGSLTVDYYPSYTELSMLNEGMGTSTIMGSGVLDTYPYALFYPLERYQDIIWHPVYFQTDGEAVQIRIYSSDAQMLNLPVVFSDFELQGMVIHTQPTTARLQ